jgi:hypothetical protein
MWIEPNISHEVGWIVSLLISYFFPSPYFFPCPYLWVVETRPASVGIYIFLNFFITLESHEGCELGLRRQDRAVSSRSRGGGGGWRFAFFFFFFPRTRVGYRGHELTRAKAWGWKPGLVICQPAKLQGWGLSPMSQDWFVYIYIFTPRLRELLSGRGTKIFYICFILFYFILFYFILFLASGSAERGGLEYILFYFMIFFLTSQSFKILFYMKSSFFLLKVHAAE